MARLWISLTKGCWVDLYEGVGFVGRRLRLQGPADYVDLRVAPPEWGDEVGSVVVGPTAYVQCFEELDFANSVVWLVPNQRVRDVSELPTREELDSIRLFDRPPFAAEAGFQSYARWPGMPPAPP